MIPAGLLRSSLRSMIKGMSEIGAAHQSDWLDKDVVEQYARAESDSGANWYEMEVNLPSLVSLIPDEAAKILDHGCGTGKITANLAAKYPEVEGADVSPAMISLAREQNPGLPFRVWDSREILAGREEYYDVVFSKLVLMFVDDLHKLADALRAVLRPGGCLVASIAHPMKTAAKKGGSYFEAVHYSHAAGARGMTAPQVRAMHRPLQDYLQPLFSAGFKLDQLNEPAIPDHFLSRCERRDIEVPKRLNVRLVKS